MAANAKCKCEFANKCAQANERCSKELSPGFTLCFAFCHVKQQTHTYLFGCIVVP